MGLFVARVDETIEPLYIGLVSTKKQKSKPHDLSNDLLCAKKLYKELNYIIKKYNVEAVAAEIPGGSQSSRASFSFGCAIALIASTDLPIIEVKASEAKLALTQDKNASKKDMINKAYEMYPELNWILYGKRLVNANEHIADALGVLLAGLEKGG